MTPQALSTASLLFLLPGLAQSGGNDPVAVRPRVNMNPVCIVAPFQSANNQVLIRYDTVVVIEQVSERINQLRSLKAGWDSYGAPAINEATLNYGLGLFAIVAIPKLPVPSVVPTRHGGVQFEWHTAQGDVEVLITAPTRYEAFFAPRKGAAIEIGPTEEVKPLRDLISQFTT